MYPKRPLSIGIAAAILLGSIALGAVPIGADASNVMSATPPADVPNATAANATPAGYGPDHIDAGTAIARHHGSVVASSSVHTALTYEATANGGASVRGVEAWTNFSRNAQRVTARAVYTSAEQYVADGVRYTNTSVSYADAPRYDRTEGDLRANRSTGRDVLSTFLPYVDFSLRQATTEGDARLFTYEATGFDADSFGIYERDVASVRSVDATLVVDERGRIRAFTFALDATADDGNPLTVEVSLELDGFGETTVRRPAWVGDEFEQDERANRTLR